MEMCAATFLPSYEKQLNNLKTSFSFPATNEWQQELRQFKRWVEQYHPPQVAISQFSSLYAVPTSQLAGSECRLHRIWLGGTIPLSVVQTITQWQLAIEASQSEFQQVLWVWDEAQIASDTHFVAQRNGEAQQIGVLFLQHVLVQVHSLEELIDADDVKLAYLLAQLHNQRYFATLSDFFRLAILLQFGGMYLDADTLPAKPATLFLCKPELPDFQGRQHVNWLNLFADETGMIITHQQNAAIGHLYQQLADVYRHWTLPLTPKTKQSERSIFEPFYHLWRQQLNVSQMSHHLFSQHYAVLGFDHRQPRISGIKGMRLQEDILSGEHLPLSEDEQHHYQRTISQLAERNWLLDDIMQLGELSIPFIEVEVLQIAYAPQLRAEIPYYHYYGVLSQDRDLDKVNALFSDYLISLNQKNIINGNFWQEVKAKNSAPIWFKPGTLTSNAERYTMAELIFSTSYLEYCSVDNRNNSDIISCQLQQNIQPFLAQIAVLYNPQSAMVGFINAAPLRVYEKIEVKYSYRHSIRQLDDVYDEFLSIHSRDDDYFLCSLALKSAYQGQGYFKAVLTWLIQQATQQQCQRIVLCVWQSSAAYAIYCHKGFEVIAVMEEEVACFNDQLVFMALAL